jgi:hypothetical protein
VAQLSLSIVALVYRQNVGESLTDSMHFEPMFYVSCGIVLLVSGVFTIPVLFLCIVHLTNFAKNKTTNERFSKQKVNNTSLTTRMNNSNDNPLEMPSFLENVEYQSFMGIQKGN